MMRAFLDMLVIAALCALLVVSFAALADSPAGKVAAGGDASVHGSVITEKAKAKRDRWHWYELSDAQQKALVASLKAVQERKPVYVLCASDDCRPLSQDVVEAFEAAGWKASLELPLAEGSGLVCSEAALCEAIEKATHIKGRVVPDARSDHAAVWFGRKGG